jgi:hypothetical protein
MSLLEKQQQFMRMLPLLIYKAHSLGYEVTAGDLFRDKRCPYGHKNSLHRSRLAIDLNLFHNKRFITTSEGHTELHFYWQLLGGSKMIDGDENHYSLGHGGII